MESKRPKEHPSLDEHNDRLSALLTRGGKIPDRVARYSLTPLERRLLVLAQGGDYRITDPGEASDPYLAVYQSATRYGLSIGWVEEDTLTLILQIEVPDSDLDLVNRLKAAASVETSLVVSRATDCLQRLEADSELLPLVDSIKHTLSHMPPVAGLIQDRSFSSAGQVGERLLSSRKELGLLDTIAEQAVQGWGEFERLVLYAFHILLSAGGAFRLETMNGMQWDPITLEEQILLQTRAVCGAAGRPALACIDVGGNDLLSKAAVLNAVTRQESSRLEVYRLINGTTFNRTVVYRKPRSRSHDRIRDKLRQAIGSIACTDADSALDWELFLQHATLEALFSASMPQLLEAVITTGLKETNSDFFMSRAIREFCVPLDPSAIDQNDFFCIVLARLGLDGTECGLTKYDTDSIRLHQARRMQFNGWKYWHGNLDPSEQKQGQYFFNPPTMADIAHHENTFHKGHQDNGVAQSIRVPGDLRLYRKRSESPRTFVCAFDVRAARATMNVPYRESDLAVVCTIHDWLKTIYQTLADRARTGESVRIDQFSAEYYKAYDS